MAARTSHEPIPPGTLEMLVLTALARRTELHGFEIAEVIERASTDVLCVEDGSHPYVVRSTVAGSVRAGTRRRSSVTRPSHVQTVR